MRLFVYLATSLMCSAAYAQEPVGPTDGLADPDLLSDTSDIFEIMLQRGCSVATDGCTTYQQKVWGGIPMRQQTLKACPGVPRRFVCQQ